MGGGSAHKTRSSGTAGVEQRGWSSGGGGGAVGVGCAQWGGSSPGGGEKHTVKGCSTGEVVGEGLGRGPDSHFLSSFPPKSAIIQFSSFCPSCVFKVASHCYIFQFVFSACTFASMG